MISNKCHNKLKPLLDKKIKDKFNIISFFNLLDDLGFDNFESREIYSYYLTNGKTNAILPWEWLESFFNNHQIVNESTPTEVRIIINKDFIESISINHFKKEITVKDDRILHFFMNYYMISEDFMIEHIRRWIKHTAISPFYYFTDFTIKTIHSEHLGGESFYRMAMNSSYGIPRVRIDGNEYRDYTDYLGERNLGREAYNTFKDLYQINFNYNE